MTQSFVRYSPGIEWNDPNFERALQTVLDDMRRHTTASAEAEGAGRVVREAHGKGFGLARGEVEILKGIAARICARHLRKAWTPRGDDPLLEWHRTYQRRQIPARRSLFSSATDFSAQIHGT
jgi:hypothetical protein